MAIPSFGGPFNYNTQPLEVDLGKIQGMASQNALRNIQTQTAQQDFQGVNAIKNALAKPGVIGPDGMLTPQGAQNVLAAHPVLGAKIVSEYQQLAQHKTLMDEQKARTEKYQQDAAIAAMPYVHAGEEQMDAAWSAALAANGGDVNAARAAQMKVGKTLADGWRKTGILNPAQIAAFEAGLPSWDPVTAKQQMEAEKSFAMQKQEMEGTPLVSDSTGERWLVNKKGEYFAYVPGENRYVSPSFSRPGQGGGGAAKIPTDLRPANQPSIESATTKAAAIAAATTAARIETTRNSGSSFSPDELSFLAKQAWAGDTSVFQNVGRGSQGAKNIEDLRRAVIQEGLDSGRSPEELAAKNAEFVGIKAAERTLGNRQANIDMAVTEAQNLIPLALKASDEAKRTGIKSVNDLVQFAQGATASPELRRLAGATNALINVYARAINPQGVPTVSDKNHAREILDKAFATGDYAAAVDQMRQEMDAAQKSPGLVRQDLRESITGKSAGGPKVGDVLKGYRFKGGDPAKPDSWEKVP